MLLKKLSLVFVLFLFAISPSFAQDADSVTGNVSLIKDSTVITEEEEFSKSLLKQMARQYKRDSIRAKKKIWLSILGGPTYTPEGSLGVGGAVLASFRLNKNDSISQRSFIPAGFNLTINGTIVVAGASSLFFNENKFRIYTQYGYRNEPAHYFGKGYESIKNTTFGDSTTKYKKETVYFNPRFAWQVLPDFYIGALFDINYSRSWHINPVMQEDPYFNKFSNKYTNIGLGGIVQYDTRDDVATPGSGMLLSATGKVFGRYFGGKYNYQMVDLEYRQFEKLFNRRSILAWIVRSQMSFGDVPFTELPMFGSPFDLRGYFWGKYRDKTMAYSIVEYRHMFGTEEDYKRGALKSKFGFVGWVGTGTIGDKPVRDWSEWKFNYGLGLRIQLQPRKNFRLDIGKAHGVKGMLVYMNMTEAF